MEVVGCGVRCSGVRFVFQAVFGMVIGGATVMWKHVSQHSALCIAEYTQKYVLPIASNERTHALLNTVQHLDQIRMTNSTLSRAV